MKLRDTWYRPEGAPVLESVCIWCGRLASLCVIVDPCDSRVSLEEDLRVPHGLGCGCCWCLPVRPGISAPPSSEMVRRMDAADF